MARTKAFDTQEVLEKAMYVFWEHGYEHTSMQQLVDTMGIHRRSIYDTFGDKHQLFLAVLHYYETMLSQTIEQKLTSSMTTYEKLDAVFSIATATTDSLNFGCLLVNTATELSAIDPVIAKEVQGFFTKEEEYLNMILVQAKENQELPITIDTQHLSAYLHNAFVGIRVLAKTEHDQTKLKQIIYQTLQYLPLT